MFRIRFLQVIFRFLKFLLILLESKIETCTEILSKKVIAQALESLFYATWVDSDVRVLLAICGIDVLDPLQLRISHVGFILFRVKPALVLPEVEKAELKNLALFMFSTVPCFSTGRRPIFDQLCK